MWCTLCQWLLIKVVVSCWKHFWHLSVSWFYALCDHWKTKLIWTGQMLNEIKLIDSSQIIRVPDTFLRQCVNEELQQVYRCGARQIIRSFLWIIGLRSRPEGFFYQRPLFYLEHWDWEVWKTENVCEERQWYNVLHYTSVESIVNIVRNVTWFKYFQLFSGNWVNLKLSATLFVKKSSNLKQKLSNWKLVASLQVCFMTFVWN